MNLKISLALLFLSTFSLIAQNQELGFWEKVKKITNKKEIFVDCQRFCMPANQHEKVNNCNGVYYRQWKKSVKHRPKSVRPLYYFSRNGGICARKNSLNFRKKIKFKLVEQMCDCNSVLAPGGSPTNRNDTNKPITAATKNKLILLRDKVKNWMLCHDLSYGRIATAESVKSCAKIKGVKIPLTNGQLGKVEGDKIYHMGQLCLSGAHEFCAGVKECQDTDPQSSTFGAFYRSPGTKNDPTYEGNKGTHFSRDMLLGLLGYLVTTKDKEAAINWINFIEKNKKVPRVDVPVVRWLKKTNICPLIGGKSKADDRCALVADSWGLLFRIYDFLGLMNSSRISRKMKRKMKWGRLATGVAGFFNAAFSPGDANSVYMGTLVVNNILIRKKTGQDLFSMRFGAKQMAKKSRYLNPYFTYADMGPTEHGAKMLLKYCPPEQPRYGEKAFPGGPWVDGVNLWHRLSYFQTRQPYGSYQVSGGYDCMMALNYYLGYNKVPL
ncbi:hypothetical protein N9N67_02455 [Bacteriovoracaceae bacterium]|nr:hypothetical protein [Bacteriovoracaceae bacterium]